MAEEYVISVVLEGNASSLTNAQNKATKGNQKMGESAHKANVEFLEDKLKLLTGRKYVVACSNGTDALHFALRSLGIRKGDEVLVPQFSWISTASCVSMVGATPVFCEPNI